MSDSFGSLSFICSFQDSGLHLCLPSAIQKPFLFFEADKLRDSYIYEVETRTIEEAKRPNLADLSPHGGLRKKFRAFLLEWNYGGLILWVFFFFFFLMADLPKNSSRG